MINPTLFIGLGTTGIKILEYLQELVFEVYGVHSPPIFKYLAIESDERQIVDTHREINNKIDVIYTPIRDTELIREELAKGRKKYLTEWLDVNILNAPGSRFDCGAALIRQAGRLCLWENWDKYSYSLREAEAIINSYQNKDVTENFLRQYYHQIRYEIDPNIPVIGRFSDVYIFGTLCGGTCGGMFIDICYYVKWLLNLWSHNLLHTKELRLTGIFTVFDFHDLMSSAWEEIPQRKAANCWASFLEYDYYCHPNTSYNITFPDGTKINTSEPPLDFCYILSCSGNDSGFRRNDGSPDLDSLNHMAAVAIFLEAGGLSDYKDAITSKYRCASTRPYKPNSNNRMACISSCGVATVAYPKYQIAKAVAFSYGKQILEEWRGEIDLYTCLSIDKEATNVWNDILNNGLPIFTSGVNGSLEKEIQWSFVEKRHMLLEMSAEDLVSALKSESRKLDEKGIYHQYINDPNRKYHFRSDIIGAIEQAIRERINKTKNLAYAYCFLDKLNNIIARIIDNLLSRYPVANHDIDEVGLKPDLWSRITFRSKSSLREKKEHLLKECESYILAQIPKIRDFCIKPVLEDITEILGVRKELPKDRAAAAEQTLKQRLDNIKFTLDKSTDWLHQRAKIWEYKRPTQNVKIITRKESVKDDIEALFARLKNLEHTEKDEILRKIMNRSDGQGMSLSEFLGYGVNDFPYEKVISSVYQVLFQKSWSLMSIFNICDELVKKHDLPEIKHFVKNAEPHLELTGNLASGILPYCPSFIVGKDESYDCMEDLRCKLDPDPFDRLQFEKLIHIPCLNHMLVFYKEENLLYMDENLATAKLFEERYNQAIFETRFCLHTHKYNPFDPRISNDEKL